MKKQWKIKEVRRENVIIEIGIKVRNFQKMAWKKYKTQDVECDQCAEENTVSVQGKAHLSCFAVTMTSQDHVESKLAHHWVTHMNKAVSSLLQQKSTAQVRVLRSRQKYRNGTKPSQYMLNISILLLGEKIL